MNEAMVKALEHVSEAQRIEIASNRAIGDSMPEEMFPQFAFQRMGEALSILGSVDYERLGKALDTADVPLPPAARDVAQAGQIYVMVASDFFLNVAKHMSDAADAAKVRAPEPTIPGVTAP